MNKYRKAGIILIVGVLAVLFMTVAFLTTQTNEDYYAQVDNRWVTEIAPHGLMNYKYSLVAYNSSGEAKDITFETSKILKDQAFINLKVAPIRGVVTWAEINYEELPEKEKVYDRNSSVETLKLIMKLGFKISKDEK